MTSSSCAFSHHRPRKRKSRYSSRPWSFPSGLTGTCFSTCRSNGSFANIRSPSLAQITQRRHACLRKLTLHQTSSLGTRPALHLPCPCRVRRAAPSASWCCVRLGLALAEAAGSLLVQLRPRGQQRLGHTWTYLNLHLCRRSCHPSYPSLHHSIAHHDQTQTQNEQQPRFPSRHRQQH